MEPAEISGAAIAKRLASCNQSSRNRAVRFLCSWLPSQNGDPSAAGLSDAELLKIWKGLFFCIWHSDKLPAQVELINRLASLLSSLPPPLAGRYLEAFLLTIRREWSGIDYLRLDKFYLLVRRFLRHLFVFLKKNSWNLDLTGQMVGVILEGSLLSKDKFMATGVNYHIAEIFLDEIVEFLPLAKETLDLLLKPFFLVMQSSADKVLVNKIKVNIFDRLAENGSNLLSQAELGGEVEKFGKIALAMGLSTRFFDLASAAETQQGNRKVLFSLRDRYLKLEKLHNKSGIGVSLEQLDSGSSVQESICFAEATEVASTGSVGNASHNESDNGPIQKKMIMKAKKALDGTELKNMAKKKKKKKSLNSSIQTHGTDSGKTKKSKKQKNKLADSPAESSYAEAIIGDSSAIVNNDIGDWDSSESNNFLNFDDTLVSNLQKQFEKVAAEAGMSDGSNTKVLKKRKRVKSTDNKQTLICSKNLDGNCEAGNSMVMNVKKVRFSMKSNLVWKPQNPLPPQSMRLPPSVTPRGSALKKGVSPGPIRESPPTIRKIKVKGSSVKMGRKNMKLSSPAMKRLSALKKVLSPGPISQGPPTVKKIKVMWSSAKKGRKNLKMESPVIKHLQLLQSLSG